jgi:hypothetical protein
MEVPGGAGTALIRDKMEESYRGLGCHGSGMSAAIDGAYPGAIWLDQGSFASVSFSMVEWCPACYGVAHRFNADRHQYPRE